jgi:YggT family protein
MFIIANFLNAVAYILNSILTIYMYVIVARAILSWVNPDPYNPIVSFLYRITEPVLYRIRRRLPPMGGLDLSPLIVLLAIVFLQKFLVTTIFELVSRLKFGLGG